MKKSNSSRIPIAPPNPPMAKHNTMYGEPSKLKLRLSDLRRQTTSTSMIPSRQSRGMKDLLAQLPKLTVEELPPTLYAFAFFSRLPLDLRLKIWGLVSLLPREVKVLVSMDRYSKSQVEGQHKIPAILHINKEARREAMNHYTRGREVRCQLIAGKMVKVVNPMYFNFAVDNFVYNDSYGTTHAIEDYCFDLPIISKIQFITCRARQKAAWGSFDSFPIALQDNIRQLRELRFEEEYSAIRLLSEEYVEANGSLGAYLLLKARKNYMEDFLDGFTQDSSPLPASLRGVALACEVLQRERGLDIPVGEGTARCDGDADDVDQRWVAYRNTITVHGIRA